MPVDNITDSTSHHHIDPASSDTSSVHHEPTTTPVAPHSRPQTTPPAQFEALADNNPSRPPVQDNTGVRLNADSSKLNAFRQRCGNPPTGQAGHPGEALDDGAKTAGMTHGTMRNQMQEMMWFQQGMASMQIQEKMFVATMEFDKQLAGDMAKLSEPIR